MIIKDQNFLTDNNDSKSKQNIQIVGNMTLKAVISIRKELQCVLRVSVTKMKIVVVVFRGVSVV